MGQPMIPGIIGIGKTLIIKERINIHSCKCGLRTVRGKATVEENIKGQNLGIGMLNMN